MGFGAILAQPMVFNFDVRSPLFYVTILATLCIKGLTDPFETCGGTCQLCTRCNNATECSTPLQPTTSCSTSPRQIHHESIYSIASGVWE